MFLFDSPAWKTFALENLLGLKLLHDRGFNIDSIENITNGFLGRFFDIMFGEENVTWEEIHIEPPPDMAEMDKDTEEYLLLEEFYNRDHYNVKIKIKDLAEIIKDAQNRELLMGILNKLVPDKDDYLDGVFPWWELFVSVSWIKEGHEITGIHIHFVDVVEGCCDEEPISLIQYIYTFIEFYDKLQSLQKGVFFYV
jgi:hypothetical protein